MNRVLVNKFLVIILFPLILLTGCAGQQLRTKSSVVDYLYPKSSDVFVEPSIPVLNIPLRVGLAFVPAGGSNSNGRNYWTNNDVGTALTEPRKQQLLETVSKNFKKHEFIKEIQIIPSPYLTVAGSFANLDQIKTMYGVDVVALVSYDQTQFTDENFLSFSYLTIVGAFVVSGEKNDTSTLVDTVVYDIASRKMLFRAPGTSQVKGHATPINLSRKLRLDSDEGFQVAFDSMIVNLDTQLSQFREKLKENPEEAKVVYRKGYGGGSMSWLFFIILMATALTYSRRKNLETMVTLN